MWLFSTSIELRWSVCAAESVRFLGPHCYFPYIILVYMSVRDGWLKETLWYLSVGGGLLAAVSLLPFMAGERRVCAAGSGPLVVVSLFCCHLMEGVTGSVLWKIRP